MPGKRASLITVLYSAAACCGTAQAENHLVDQENKAFSKTSLQISVGDTVEFRNSDDFFHNVFSLSDIKFFDLGSYPKGESKTVEFDTPGTVQVECAIHPEMQMTIEVR